MIPATKIPQQLPAPQLRAICTIPKQPHVFCIDDKRPVATKTQDTLQVIQRAPFNEFIKNLSEDRNSEKLILYTYVLADGGGDQGMLENLSGIFEKYKSRLGYKEQQLCAVYAPSFTGNRSIINNANGQYEYPDDSRTLLPAKGANDYEIQCPVPDPSTPDDDHSTKVFEMGPDGIEARLNTPYRTTIPRNSDQAAVGMIIPDNPERNDNEHFDKTKLSNPYLYSLLENCNTIGEARGILQNIVLINVRNGDEDGAVDFPPYNRIHTFLTQTGKTTAFLLKKVEDTGFPDIICIGKILHKELPYFQSILPASALVVSGGEAFFSESMAPGVKAGKLFAPRYRYQYAVLQHAIERLADDDPQKALALEGIEILAQFIFSPTSSKLSRPTPPSQPVSDPQKALEALQAVIAKMKDLNISKTIEENLSAPSKRPSAATISMIIATILVIGIGIGWAIKSHYKKS